jgi:hypothetical protein
MALIKNIEEFRLYLKADVSNEMESLLPFVKNTQDDYIKDILGEELFDKMEAWYNADPAVENSKYKELLPFIQDALAKFTVYVAAPSIDTRLSAMGFEVSMTATSAPASKERVKAIRDSMLELGWQQIEKLQVFLLKNKGDYTDWVGSDAYIKFTEVFIKTAEEFNKYVNIDKSRLKFEGFRTDMKNVETLQIESTISKALADTIKEEVLANNVSTANKVILPNILKATANLTAFEAEMGLKYKNIGEHYLSTIREIIDKNPDNYPLYKASDIYEADRTSYYYENSAENKTFTFGH